MSHPFAACWRSLDQHQRLDTALTRSFYARQRAWRRECWLAAGLALSLVGNLVLTWRLWP